jgi:hypothetical protein
MLANPYPQIALASVASAVADESGDRGTAWRRVASRSRPSPPGVATSAVPQCGGPPPRKGPAFGAQMFGAQIQMLFAAPPRRSSAHSFIRRRLVLLRRCAESGMTTAEYAVGTVAACGFAALLWTIVHSSAVQNALTGLLTKALSQL